ncbi:MAG: hypothetical protein JNL61_19615 [Rhizobiaceae bacterium]|nr:hypothetical protein [Rhizobiaceae bacterium]
MARLPLVLMALLLGSGVAFAQNAGSKPSTNEPAAEAAAPVKPKKKKGREWGRFSSARVGDTADSNSASGQDSTSTRKIGQSPRAE